MVQCLKSCVFNILETASFLGAQTLCIPSIATGTHGFPPDLNGYVIVQCVLDWCMACKTRDLKSIKLVNFDRNIHEAFKNSFQDGLRKNYVYEEIDEILSLDSKQSNSINKCVNNFNKSLNQRLMINSQKLK